MKKKATVISLVCSVIVLCLLCALFAGLMLWGDGGSFFGGVFHIKSYNETGYQTGDAVFQAEDLKNVKIDWISGSVDLRVHDKPTIEVTETYTGSDDGRMRVRYENGELTVKFSKPKWFFGFGHFRNKNLTVLIPLSLADQLDLVSLDNVSSEVSISGISGEKIHLSTVSGDVRGTGLTFSDADFDGVSGKISIEDGRFQDLRMDTVSGGFSLAGEVLSGRFNTVSGEISLCSLISPEKIRTDSVSGSVRLEIPADSTFRASVDKVSGKLETEFSGGWNGDVFTVGDGRGDFNFETVSGDIHILAK